MQLNWKLPWPQLIYRKSYVIFRLLVFFSMHSYFPCFHATWNANLNSNALLLWRKYSCHMFISFIIIIVCLKFSYSNSNWRWLSAVWCCLCDNFSEVCAACFWWVLCNYPHLVNSSKPQRKPSMWFVCMLFFYYRIELFWCEWDDEYTLMDCSAKYLLVLHSRVSDSKKKLWKQYAFDFDISTKWSYWNIIAKVVWCVAVDQCPLWQRKKTVGLCCGMAGKHTLVRHRRGSEFIFAPCTLYIYIVLLYMFNSSVDQSTPDGAS